MTFGWFQRLRVLKRIFVSRKLKYPNFDIMKCSYFLNFVFRKRRFIAENWLCFRACNSRIVTYGQEFCLVVWFLCFNHFYGIFWKVFLKEIMVLSKTFVVFEIVSLKGLNKFWSNYLFPFDCWVKDLFAIMEESLKTFPFWELTFFCLRKLNFCILGGWLWSQASRKVLMCSLFLNLSMKKKRGV